MHVEILELTVDVLKFRITFDSIVMLVMLLWFRP